MNLILRDYLRRWGWMLAIGVLLAITRLGDIGMSKQLPENRFASLIIIYLGPLDLLIDLGRGYALTILTLPVSLKELARAWWWTAVGLPSLALTVLSILAFMITGVATGHWHTLPAFGGYCAANVLMLGALFFTITELPSRPDCGWPKRIRGYSAGFFCGWCIYGNHSDFSTPSGKVFAAVTGVMTILGWFRTVPLVHEYAGFRRTANGARRSAPTIYRPSAGGGLEFFVSHFYLRMVLTGLVVGAAVFLFAFWTGGRTNVFVNSIVWTITLQSGGSLLHLLIILQMFPACLHGRFLRTLPLSATKLAAVLVFTPLLAILTVIGFGTVVLAAVSGTSLDSLAGLLLHAYWLPLGLVLLVVPMLVWRGWDRISCFMLIILLTSSTVFSMLNITDHFENMVPPPDAGIDTSNLKMAVLFPASYNLFALLLVLAAFLLTKLALERSSLAYRPRLGALNSRPGFGTAR